MNIRLRRAIFVFCFCLLAVKSAATSVVAQDAVMTVTNRDDSIASCSIKFASETNKIPIAAAEKVLALFDKLIESKSAAMASDYVMMKKEVDIEDFLVRSNIDFLLNKLEHYVEEVLNNCSLEALQVVDGVMSHEIREARLISKIFYYADYESMKSKMSDDQYKAFVIILASNRAKINERFVSVLVKKGFTEKRNSEIIPNSSTNMTPRITLPDGDGS